MGYLKVLLALHILFQSKQILAKRESKYQNQKIGFSFGDCPVEVNEPCSSGKILFYLYTDETGGFPIQFTASDRRFSVYLNKFRPTKILIHGYTGHLNSREIGILRAVYLHRKNVNLIVVDWGQLAALSCYTTAVISIWQTGKCIAEFVKVLFAVEDFPNIHALGFSLGAHAAAIASNHLQRIFNQGFGRITGLDPALPFFASLGTEMKLDKEDGDFVDVIHTNVGVFGKIEPTGHVDFYMNGGFSQPACQYAENVAICSHLMAIVYYAESILDLGIGFMGTPCENHFLYLIGWCNNYEDSERILMGEKCDSRSRGVYFVQTGRTPPYALG